MPIRDCPFTTFNGYLKPVLPIEIVNPETGLFLRTEALIDTGADECALPSWFAEVLGHKLERGERKPVRTGSGKTYAYSHITTFKVYHPKRQNDCVYTIEHIPVDFMSGLEVPLLGQRNFLSRFILTINYPHCSFSIMLPEIDSRGI